MAGRKAAGAAHGRRRRLGRRRGSRSQPIEREIGGGATENQQGKAAGYALQGRRIRRRVQRW
jgi:hypothetical protein